MIQETQTRSTRNWRQMMEIYLFVLTAIAVVMVSTMAAAAQSVIVVGTGTPNLDVPAVQAAVDQGGNVVLKGHFSFNRPPSKPAGTTFGHMVLVSKKVVISGIEDEHGEMTTIEGGDIPFAVAAM